MSINSIGGNGNPGSSDNDPYGTVAYKRVVKQIVDKILLPKVSNFYPILHTRLAQHNGLDITGTFETDDNTTNGRLCYITVLRDPESLDPTSGLGFAWMKGDGTKFNVYLVDNSPLSDDLFINTDFVVQPQGDNAWRAAGRVVITASTVYNFRLTIGQDFSTSLKIWSGGSEPSLPTLNVGAPVNGPAAAGSDFGIGILGTNNCQWWFDDLMITTSVGVHTAVVFKMKARTTDFPNGTSTAFNYYGYASDGGGSPTYGASAFVWKQTAGVWGWSSIGTNTSTNASNRLSTKIATNFIMGSGYRDAGEFCNFLVTSTNSASSVTEVSSYYANLQTAMPSGIHTGGCADIYINDPSKILLASNTINNVTGNIDLSAANGFYLPIHSIVSVEDGILGDTLVENDDWTLVSPDRSAVFSTTEYPYLSFNPALTNRQVRIKYRWWQSGVDIQTLVDSDTYRYSATSNMVKMMPPTLVTINLLSYQGPVSETVVINTIKSYINESTSYISMPEIVNLLYSIGVTFVDLPNADVTVTPCDYLRVITDPIAFTTTYTLGDLTAFFADETSLAGVRRI